MEAPLPVWYEELDNWLDLLSKPDANSLCLSLGEERPSHLSCQRIPNASPSLHHTCSSRLAARLTSSRRRVWHIAARPKRKPGNVSGGRYFGHSNLQLCTELYGHSIQTKPGSPNSTGPADMTHENDEDRHTFRWTQQDDDDDGDGERSMRPPRLRSNLARAARENELPQLSQTSWRRFGEAQNTSHTPRLNGKTDINMIHEFVYSGISLFRTNLFVVSTYITLIGSSQLGWTTVETAI